MLTNKFFYSLKMKVKTFKAGNAGGMNKKGHVFLSLIQFEDKNPLHRM